MLAIIFAALVGLATPAPEQFALHAPKAVLMLAVARTEEQREDGLMYRRSLGRHSGMLFIFPSDGPVAFWMKDTLIPLDMIFVSHAGIVRKIFKDVPVVDPKLPDEKIPLENGNAEYVIELPANEASADGIVVGTSLSDLRALFTKH